MSWHLQLLSKTCDWWHPGEQLLLKAHMHLMSSFLPTMWGESTLWINEDILHDSSQLHVQSALMGGHLPCFFLFATRHPLCAPLMHTRGRVLRRSWLFFMCQCCFSWHNHRQDVEDFRGMAWRLLSPSWHLLLEVFFIMPFLTHLSGCGRSVPLTLVSGLLVLKKSITNNSCSPSTCWVYLIPRHLSVLPWSESCSCQGKDLGESSCVYLLQNPDGWKDFRIEYYWSLPSRLKSHLHAIKSAWSSKVCFLWCLQSLWMDGSLVCKKVKICL